MRPIRGRAVERLGKQPRTRIGRVRKVRALGNGRGQQGARAGGQHHRNEEAGPTHAGHATESLHAHLSEKDDSMRKIERTASSRRTAKRAPRAKTLVSISVHSWLAF